MDCLRCQGKLGKQYLECNSYVALYLYHSLDFRGVLLGKLFDLLRCITKSWREVFWPWNMTIFIFINILQFSHCFFLIQGSVGECTNQKRWESVWHWKHRDVSRSVKRWQQYHCDKSHSNDFRTHLVISSFERFPSPSESIRSRIKRRRRWASAGGSCSNSWLALIDPAEYIFKAIILNNQWYGIIEVLHPPKIASWSNSTLWTPLLKWSSTPGPWSTCSRSAVAARNMEVKSTKAVELDTSIWMEKEQIHTL